MNNDKGYEPRFPYLYGGILDFYILIPPGLTRALKGGEIANLPSRSFGHHTEGCSFELMFSFKVLDYNWPQKEQLTFDYQTLHIVPLWPYSICCINPLR